MTQFEFFSVQTLRSLCLEHHIRCPNDPQKFPALIAELIAWRPARIVLEATGGLERPLLQALQAARLPVVLVNPRQVRDFAKALGLLAKTDRLDARVLAHFAAAIQPPISPIKASEDSELDALMGRRNQLSDMLVAEKNRRGSAATKAARADIEAHIEWLEQRLKASDKQLKDQLKRSVSWQQKDLLCGGFLREILNHRDTENTELSQRKPKLGHYPPALF